jgi:hypothetical protein
MPLLASSPPPSIFLALFMPFNAVRSSPPYTTSTIQPSDSCAITPLMAPLFDFRPHLGHLPAFIKPPSEVRTNHAPTSSIFSKKKWLTSSTSDSGLSFHTRLHVPSHTFAWPPSESSPNTIADRGSYATSASTIKMTTPSRWRP